MAEQQTELKKGDVVVTFDPTELEKELEDGNADKAVAVARYTKEQLAARGSRAKRREASDLAQKELATASAFGDMTDESVYSRNEIIESALDKQLATARMKHASSASSIEQRLSKSKMELIGVEQRKAQLKIAQAQEGLSALTITAPHDGVVTFKRDWMGNLPQVGQQVWAGQPVAEIPEMSQMQAEVFVLEIDGEDFGSHDHVDCRFFRCPSEKPFPTAGLYRRRTIASCRFYQRT